MAWVKRKAKTSLKKIKGTVDQIFETDINKSLFFSLKKLFYKKDLKQTLVNHMQTYWRELLHISGFMILIKKQIICAYKL